MKFTWIGGPTFVLELGAFRILGDPVFADALEMAPHGEVIRVAPLPDVDASDVDAVCVSSFRPDHFDPSASSRLGAGTTLVAPPMVGADPGFSDARMLVHWASVELVKDGEKLAIHATPASGGNGYFFKHASGEKTSSVYWTGDALWSDDVRRVQQEHGYANLLVIHIGAEAGEGDVLLSPGGKEAMQIVYRMQPNAIAAVHHNTFSHYTEPIAPFADLIGRTIYEKRLRALSEGESFEKKL
jgi:L-ascorbate metabolism protein UlaG (beta-lactamase superfamily)